MADRAGLAAATSKQAEWIRQHAQALDSAGGVRPPQTDNQWAQAMGPAGSAATMGDRSTAQATPRFKLTSILSFLAFVVIYSAASGVKFGIGFAVLILIHEMGHFVDIKRRGLPADMPCFCRAWAPTCDGTRWECRWRRVLR